MILVPKAKKRLPVVAEDSTPVSRKKAVNVEVSVVPDSGAPPSVSALIEEVLALNQTKLRFFRPSMVGGCRRANAYHYQGVPKEPTRATPQLQRILDTGTALHEVVQRYIGNHEGVFFAPEVKVYDPSIPVRGSCDGVMIERATGYRWILEIKTIGEKGFSELKDAKPEHITQATVYMALLGIEWCSFIYLNKNTQKIREFRVKFDPALWREVQSWYRELRSVVDSGGIPEFDKRECSGSIDLCPFVRHCESQRGIHYDEDQHQ